VRKTFELLALGYLSFGLTGCVFLKDKSVAGPGEPFLIEMDLYDTGFRAKMSESNSTFYTPTYSYFEGFAVTGRVGNLDGARSISQRFIPKYRTPMGGLGANPSIGYQVRVFLPGRQCVWVSVKVWSTAGNRSPLTTKVCGKKDDPKQYDSYLANPTDTTQSSEVFLSYSEWGFDVGINPADFNQDTIVHFSLQ
jgi:hypothetical protein